MPIYEFRCERCGERFEALVEAGTESAACRACGASETIRVYSAQTAPMSLVKTPAEKRRQERRNAQLHARAKADFKASRRPARGTGKGSGDG